MKSLTLIASLIMIIVNILAGVILKCYHTENVIMSSSVILVNALLLWAVATSDMKDAFKVSFHILFPVFAIIEFVLALFLPNRWDNNFFLVGIIVCLAFQAVLVFAATLTSKHNKKYDNL